MTNETKSRVNGSAGWVTALIAVAGILVVIGGVYARVCTSTDADIRQDNSIAALEKDMAVMKATTTRTASDVEEIKLDVKTLLRRP